MTFSDWPTLALSTPDMALIGLLLCATWTDLRTRKIPNILSVSGFLFALLLGLSQAGVAGIWFAMKGAGLGLLILLPLFAIRVMGAGDVKLLAAAGAYSGAPAVVSIALLTFIAGGVLALVYLVRVKGAAVCVEQFKLTLATRSLAAVDKTQVRLPYAVAMLCGTLSWMGMR